MRSARKHSPSTINSSKAIPKLLLKVDGSYQDCPGARVVALSLVNQRTMCDEVKFAPTEFAADACDIDVLLIKVSHPRANSGNGEKRQWVIFLEHPARLPSRCFEIVERSPTNHKYRRCSFATAMRRKWWLIRASGSRPQKIIDDEGAGRAVESAMFLDRCTHIALGNLWPGSTKQVTVWR